MEILSREYSKQLPPLNWCFIQELYHENESKFYCIDLASHQVMLSGSARRFMENVISINSEIIDKNIIISIYKNLKYLANSIQPVNLQPFLQNSFNFSINDKELLNIIIEELKFVLKSKNIEDTNKYTIANVLIDKLKQDTNVRWKTFLFSLLIKLLLDVLIDFPLYKCISSSFFRKIELFKRTWNRNLR